jgi:hypothetical protein
MKKIGISLIFSLFALMLTLQVNAQSKPAASPLGKVYQRVGVTDIEVTYSRPGVKDRKIFAEDGLTPFGNLWRTGANGATTISLSTDAMIGGKKVPAGTYSILSIPGKEKWTIIINSDAGLRGAGGYDEAKDVARFEVEPAEFPFSVETLTFVFGTVKDTSAYLDLIWEKTLVSIPIEVEKTW